MKRSPRSKGGQYGVRTEYVKQTVHNVKQSNNPKQKNRNQMHIKNTDILTF
ncbi:MAG: hypothetical protein Q8843_01655 [Candidatus Phytoplasma australasiaticum]|nr:hypothetical protein [Candidatus Phytoplasma australasiaticum]